MTLVEKFSIIGSIASATAIAVSLLVFWRQRYIEIKRIEEDRAKEFSALKKVITSKIIYLEYQIDWNESAFQLIKDNPSRKFILNKFDDSFYINMLPENANGNTMAKIYKLANELDGYFFSIARHSDDLIGGLIVLSEVIKLANDLIFAVVEHIDKSDRDKVLTQIEYAIKGFDDIRNEIKDINDIINKQTK
ncbi:hypothetical protein CYG68_01890 [Morganella morganii]|uniref:Uncharacterized protein n=1 Tax=Morganella morganii TaxID=582 RepID=A0A8I0PRX7_MORMO|nr:hypothetical protein [Morganella morganii]MBE8611178.1 hypothetical protein [Morganella morganii]